MPLSLPSITIPEIPAFGKISGMPTISKLPNLADTTLTAGPKDSMAVADIYEKISGFPLNDITVTQSLTSLDLAGDLRGAVGKVLPDDSLLNKAKGLAESAKSAADEMLDRVKFSASNPLSSALNTARGSLSGLVDNLPTKALGTMVSSIPGGGTLLASVNGITSKIGVGSFGSVSGLMNSMGGAGCATGIGFFDPSSALGMLMAAIQRAIKSGIRNAFSAIGCLIPGLGDINKVVNGTVRSAIGMGDISSISAMNKMVSPGALKGMVPDIFSGITNGYKKPMQCTVDDINGDYTSTIGVFGEVDSGWSSSNREVGAFNATSIMNASDDFRDVFKRGALNSANESEKMLYVASNFKSNDPFATLGSQFYNASLSGNSVKANYLTTGSVLDEEATKPSLADVANARKQLKILNDQIDINTKDMVLIQNSTAYTSSDPAVFGPAQEMYQRLSKENGVLKNRIKDQYNIIARA